MKILYIISALLININFASAINLTEALINTYNYNQELNAARENAKEGNETQFLALTNFLPKINAKYSKVKDKRTDITSTYLATKSVTKYNSQIMEIKQPIFRSGGNLATYKKSLKEKAALMAKFSAIEQKILLSAIKAYIEVIDKKRATELSKKNIEVLEKYLISAQEKQKFGEATKTDVAQAQSRLSTAKSQDLSNIGLYESAKASFENIIGLKAENLETPKIENYLEILDLEELKSKALLFNKNLIKSINDVEAANCEIMRRMTDLLPNLNLTYQFSKIDPREKSNLLIPQRRNSSISLDLEIPIFQGGSEYVRLKSAKRQHNSMRFSHQNLINSTLEETIKLWHNHQISISKIEATKAAEEAEKIASEGVKQEAEMGVRTMIELLDAEKELFNAKIAALKANTDLIMSYYSIKFLVGELSLEKLIETNYH